MGGLVVFVIKGEMFGTRLMPLVHIRHGHHRLHRNQGDHHIRHGMVEHHNRSGCSLIVKGFQTLGSIDYQTIAKFHSNIVMTIRLPAVLHKDGHQRYYNDVQM